MPLIPAESPAPLHLDVEVEDTRPRVTAPSAPTPPGRGRADLRRQAVQGVMDDTRRSWPLVLFHLLVLGGTVGYAATATAQPIEAAGITPEAIQAVAGDPWATVVVAVLFVGGQLVAAWRDWSKVRAADLDAAKLKIERLEGEAVAASKEIARLEARAELAQLREGDARAAASGSSLRPPSPPGE